MAQHPDHRAAAVCGEHRVVVGVGVDQPGQLLRMDQAVLAGAFLVAMVLLDLGVVVQLGVEEFAVVLRLQLWLQRIERGGDVADDTDVDGVAAAEVAGIQVDLNHPRLVRIELAPGEVAAEQHKRVALGHRVVAGLGAEDAGHAHVVGIVRLDEVLGPRGVGHRRLQRLAQPHDLGVSALAADAGIDGDLAAVVEDAGDGVQLAVAGPNDGLGNMHGIGRADLDLDGADVAGHDQHRDAALGQRRLGRQGGQPLGLVRIVDLFAEHRTGLVNRPEVDRLREVDAQLVTVDLAGDQHHRRAVAVAFE